MEIALLLIGVITLTAAVRGTHAQFFALLKDDFTGPDNFVIWLSALFAIGAIGYYKPLKPVSNAFLFLVIVVMILAQSKNGKGGFFQQLEEQISATQQTPTTVNAGTGGATDGTGGVLQEAESGLKTAMSIANPVKSALKSIGL